ncbi:MAG: class I adenylate-forming enzyme family protein [Arcanobacterium sp.]|nr:class I adenylate-forming enzyme family protein [Arcanobacterium sp.]
MLRGEDCWPTELTSDMEHITVAGREVRTYMPTPSSLYETLVNSAQKFASKPAIVTEDSHSYTFAEVLALVDNFARLLYHEHGITENSRVGLLLDNGIDFITSFYALNRLGAVAVPLPGKFRKAEILALVARADLDLVICHPEQSQWFGGCRVIVSNSNSCAYGLPIDEQHGEEPPSVASLAHHAILLFTSGTTSQSKGVLLSNLNAVHAVRSYARVLGLSSSDSTIIAVPIYHVTGMIAIIGLFLYLGGTIHVQKRMVGRSFVREVFISNISFIHASPTVFTLMLEERERFPELPSVQKIACGAAHMPVSRIRALHDWMPGMEFRTIYGLTESCSPGFVFPSDAATSPFIGSSGKPIPGMDVKICDDDGAEVEVGAVGEIYLRGANITPGYDKLPEKSPGADGWLATGDVGTINNESFVYILDRKKDMINRGGEKIWCIDVEEELRGLDSVADAAVVGVPDVMYGEVGAAAIVAKPGSNISFDAIKMSLNQRLARYQVPVYFCIVPQLPLTAGGKIDKNAVKKRIIEEYKIY